MEIKKSIAEGWGKGELYDILIALNNGLGVLPVAGKTYYVSKNGNSTDGLSWKNAFATLEAAITANNLDVGSVTAVHPDFYKMNRMFIDGGNYAETLTVFPNHCEMIGVGSAPVRISVSTVLTTRVSVCHIYNMQFRTASAAPIFGLCVGCQGVEFHGCIFNSSGAAPTIGLEVEDVCYSLKVIGCKFYGLQTTSLSPTCGIQFDGTNTMHCEIRDNFISAITYGIYFATPHAQAHGVLIKNNVICRSDGNYATELVYGIYSADITGNAFDAMIINNWISVSTDALVNCNANKTIQNYVVVAGDGIVETETA